jgi:DNA-binding transcriptional ArsR family regulator
VTERSHHGLVLRIHLTSDDLLRTTIAPAPSPVWEIIHSLRLLQYPGPPPRLPGWRSRGLSRLSPGMAPLLDLVPARDSTVPDFLTPVAAGTDLETGIDAVLSTPRARAHAELLPLVSAGLVPHRVRTLWDGDAAAWRRLGHAFREYHEALIAPHWASLRAQVDADRAARGHALATGGIGRVLRTLDHRLRWDAGTLSYECAYGGDLEVAFDGQGMVLQPSLFAHEPTLLQVAGHPPVVCYPIALQGGSPQAKEPLVALLGRTRAAILTVTADGATTTELARRTGVSLASASQHAGVLRSAGLIATRRVGPAVLHTLTPLGASLLGRPGPGAYPATT